jgi:hypothetical protein
VNAKDFPDFCGEWKNGKGLIGGLENTEIIKRKNLGEKTVLRTKGREFVIPANYENAIRPNRFRKENKKRFQVKIHPDQQDHQEKDKCDHRDDQNGNIFEGDQEFDRVNLQ